MRPTSDERPRPASGFWRALVAAESPTLIYLGLAIVALGLGLIVFTYERVAGLANVALQLPYMVSGGIGGLVAVLIGLTCTNVAVKRRSMALETRRTERLVGLMNELDELMAGLISALELEEDEE